VTFYSASIAAPATDSKTAAIPVAGPLNPRREERAAAVEGVVDALEALDELETCVPEEVTEVTTSEVGVLATLVTDPGVVEAGFGVELAGVDTAEPELTVVAPIEKEGVEAKTSLMLPMLTACKV